MVIYADVVFLINFVMDIIILYITSIIIKKTTNKVRIIIGGFIGSVFYCLLMFSCLNKYYNPFTSLFTFIVPLIFVFRPRSIREFLKGFFVLNISAFTIGGFATGIFFYTNAKNYIGELLTFTVNDFSIKLLIFSSSFTYISIKLIRLKINERMQKKQHIVSIKIKNNNISKQINALVDTGNTLKEPMSDKHVIILEFAVFKDFLPNELKILFYEQNQTNITKIYDAIAKIDDSTFLEKFRLIPFKSVGNESGTLIGIRVDEVNIYDEMKKYYLKDIFIAIANFKLTQNDDFNALLNPEIFDM